MEAVSSNEGIKQYYFTKIEEIQVSVWCLALKVILSREHHHCNTALTAQS